MNHLLEVEGLEVVFEQRPAILRRSSASEMKAVDGVDLAITRGESLGIVGESGSGKTTIARAVTGLLAPTSGTIRFGGQVLGTRRSSAQRRAIQMVFQDPASSLNPALSIGRMLAELLIVHRLVPRDRVRTRCIELLDLVHLPAVTLDMHPRELSGGQRQRVSMARALAVEPQVIVADEAVSALDVSVQASVLNLLADLQENLGLSMLFISHDLTVVSHVCDRVAVMYRGKIVEIAETEQIFHNPQHDYTKVLLEAIPLLGTRSA